MIFQQEFNPQHLFSPIHLATGQVFSPKATTVLTREERIRLRKEEHRRRKLQELKSGCKRFIAMLFSHIGLSGLVIAYTIIGGILFGGIERGKEKETKTLAYEYRIDASNEFLRLLFGELHTYLSRQPQACNSTITFLGFLIDFLEKEKPTKKITSHPIDEFIETLNFTVNGTDLEDNNHFNIMNNNNSVLNGFNTTMDTTYLKIMRNSSNMKTLMTSDYQNLTYSLTEQEMDNIKGENSLKSQFIILLRGRVQIALMEFTKRIVDFIETDGWNGNDSMEDLKWSFAGSVLYAITVITTIGYGHATPKTNLGKFMTILYALIGIPLMFLYLSNIGDYLADVFRVIYSRTCRTSCEKFCSASILSTIDNNHNHIEQINKNGLQNDSTLPVDTDPAINPTHSHGRRRKRVLLQPFNTNINNTNNDDSNDVVGTFNDKANFNESTAKQNRQEPVNLYEKINKTAEETYNAQNSKFYTLKNKQFFLKLSKYYQKSRVYIKQSRLAAFFQSDSTSALAQKTKTNLRELFYPAFTWVQQMVQALVYQDDGTNQSKPTQLNMDSCNIVSGPENFTNYPGIFFQNIHQGPEYDLIHNTMTSNITSNTMKKFHDMSNISNNQADISSCRTTALIEESDANETNSPKTYEDSKQLYEQLTKKQNKMNKSTIYKCGNTITSVTDGNNSTLSNKFISPAYMFTSPASFPTVSTLPVPNKSTLRSFQKEPAKFFTFDGQHRKFYLMARYLRSVERQRRHKRRVRKQLQEQARSELHRLENEKLYGKLFQHQTNYGSEVKRSMCKINSLDSVSVDKVSTGSTVLSEKTEAEYVNHGGTIRLLCWRDIDVDLEVRSIDVNYDDPNSLKLNENTDSNNMIIDDNAAVIVNTNACDIKTQLSRTHSIKDSLRRIKCSKPCCRTPNSKSFSNFKQTTHTELSPLHTSEELKNNILKQVALTSNNTLCSSNLQSPYDHLLEYKLSSLREARPYNFPSIMNLTRPHPANIHQSYNQIPMGILPTSKLGLSNATASNSLQQHTSAVQAINPLNKDISPPLNENFKYPRTFTLPNPLSKTSQYPQRQQCSTIPHISESYSLRPDIFQRLLQSTVIANPYVVCENTLDDLKPEQMGRSRLSLASSRGDLDSEVIVQLSYYSQHDSSKTEEDLSFFSYRDGFVTEEDVSKVTVPISLSLIIMTTYILIGAIVFSIWQDPDYLKWSYFCFITLSTIGFGDIVPGTKIDSTNPKEKMIIICLYVAIGLSVFAMCFKLMQEEVVDKMKWFAFRIGILKKKETNDTTDRSFYHISRN